MAAKSPRKTKPKTMRSAKSTRRRDPDQRMLGDPLPDPAPPELPDPTNAADGCLIYVKGGKFVLTGAPLNSDCYPYWDNTTKTVKWSAV